MIGIYQDEMGTSLTTEQILAAIDWKRRQNWDIARIRSYYLGCNEAIRSRDGKHKIPVPFGRKLIKSVLGFMFKQGCISYAFPDDDSSLKSLVNGVYDANDEETENARVARDQAQFGRGYEILYVDNDDGMPQFYHVPAPQIVPVYSKELKPRMLAAINFCRWTTKDTKVEVYYNDRIEHFRLKGGELHREKVVAHRFGEVPVIEFPNNTEGMGDIESIISLIDAHDEILSNGLDEDGKYADALLLLKNIALDDDSVSKLRALRILEMDEDGEASYLTKPETYAGREILRKVIEGLIHSMSGIPKLDDREAMSQQSGEALKYLYATFEVMVAGDKEIGFTDGLMRRLRLVNNFLTWMGQSHSSLDGIEVNWKRNLPNESTTIVDNVVKATGIISRRTQVENLVTAGLVQEVKQEMDRIAEEKKADVASLIDPMGVKDLYGAETL